MAMHQSTGALAADTAPSGARRLRIGIVAGEVSGDQLAARLIRALRRHFPDAEFEGIAGPEMQAEGCHSLFPMERLSVLGLTEILGRYLELRRIRKRLVEHFNSQPPDVFVGVDSPGFNLGLEQRLRDLGIPTVHYVSPQVWAWRTWRVRKIRRAVDRILVLFPFETGFYARHDVEATFVGHPLADEIRGDDDPRPHRDRLRLDLDRPTIALLPGSRVSELKALADLFVQSAQWLHRRHPQVQFIAPFVNRRTRLLFEEAIRRQQAWDLPITRFHGHSRDAMAAADVVLLASGTATLEAMLLRRLMVVTYRVSRLSYWMMRAFAHVSLFAMPNHLAGRHLVPELMQDEATVENLGRAVERYLARPLYAREVLLTFEQLGARLRGNASERAAQAIADMLHAAPVASRVPAA
jgi:lipid-A-disaccharide synthase